MTPKLTHYTIIIAVTAFVLFIAWYFSNIIAYILIAAVLSIIAKPLLDLLNMLQIGRWKMPRSASAAIGLASIWVVTILFLYLFIPLITSEMEELAKLDIKMLGYQIAQPFKGVELLVQKHVPGATSFSFEHLLADRIASFVNAQSVTSAFGSVADFLTSLAVALFSISFITFFFMKEEKLFASGVIVLFPKKYEKNITHALKAINKLLVRYFVGMLIDIFCIMLILTLGLTFIAGLSFSTSLVISLIAGVLNVIPYIGPLIGAILGLVVGGASQPELMENGLLGAQLVRIAIVFLIMKIADDAIFQPLIFSNSIKAHPLEIFLVILIAGSIAGVFGMLMAIPAYTVIRVFAKEFFNNFRVVRKLTERMPT